VKGAFVIEPLATHDRGGFNCGVAPLDRYLKESFAAGIVSAQP
jgi:hypothetical protein